MQRRQPHQDDFQASPPAATPSASPSPSATPKKAREDLAATVETQPSSSNPLHLGKDATRDSIRDAKRTHPGSSSSSSSKSVFSRQTTWSPPVDHSKRRQQPAPVADDLLPPPPLNFSGASGPSQDASHSLKPAGIARAKSSAKRSSSRQAKGDSSRSSSSTSIMNPGSAKKARTGSSPSRQQQLNIPASATTPLTSTSIKRAQREGPKSPLFFSNKSSSRHTTRPPAFPTETTASILSRIREDSSGAVTTLKLPRASVSTTALSGSTPGSWGSSMEVSVPSLSPDCRTWPSELQFINNVGVLEILEQDDRPTFLVDLNNTANASRPGFHIHYMNPALKASRPLLNDLLILDQSDAEASELYAQFKAWLLTPVKTQDGVDLPHASYSYANVTWSSSTLRRRFRFIRADTSFLEFRTESPLPISDETVMPASNSRPASPSLPVTPDAEGLEAADYFGGVPGKSAQEENATAALNLVPMEMDADSDRRHPDDFTNQVLQSQPARDSFDWTKIVYTDSLPEHIKFARSVDWSSTSLGAIEEWPHDLRLMANMIMGSPHPSSMYWGPDFISIYNAAYIELAGKKHPTMMGSSYAVAWHEIWDEIKPIFQSAWEGGQATMKHENQLFINRHGVCHHIAL